MLNLETGFYVPTEKFKSIQEHVAICEPGGALIAVVGPSDDPRSKETAESFVRAVNNFDALLQERDRYKAALEKIASEQWGEPTYIAKEALRHSEPGT